MRDLPLFRRSSKGSPESWDEELPVALLGRRGVAEGTSLRWPWFAFSHYRAVHGVFRRMHRVADASVLLRRCVTALTDMGNENGQLRERVNCGAIRQRKRRRQTEKQHLIVRLESEAKRKVAFNSECMETRHRWTALAAGSWRCCSA